MNFLLQRQEHLPYPALQREPMSNSVSRIIVWVYNGDCKEDDVH